MPKVPQKARRIALDKRASRAALAAAALASASEQMRANTRGARKNREPDFAHQLRVGARRARVVVRLFQRRIGKARARALERGLRWVFRLLGDLRDHDLLLREVVDPLSSDELDPALELLATELTRERELALRKVKRALAGKRFARLLLALEALQQEFEQAATHDDTRARKWLRKRLSKRLESVLERRDAALGPDENARHELRKELKKLRYATELAFGLWSKKRIKQYVAQMAALQDALGALNDVATGRRLLPLAAAGAPADTSSAVALCEGVLLARLSERAPALAPAFHEFAQSEPFWR